MLYRLWVDFVCSFIVVCCFNMFVCGLCFDGGFSLVLILICVYLLSVGFGCFGDCYVAL